MLDNQLIQLFLPLITAGLTAQGYSGVSVTQSFQPTQQGAFTGPAVYFFKIGDHRYGFLGRTNVWDSVHGVEVHTETQNYETTFQVSAWVRQVPGVSTYTASDLVNVVSGILQSDSTVFTLAANDVGIYRITDVRNPYFVDDRDQHEASPLI